MSERVYYCETKFLEISGNVSRGFPEQPIRYHCIGGIRNISHEDFRDATIYSWQNFMEVCGVVLEYTTNAKTANIILRGVDIDGPGKTLGRAWLPLGVRRNSDRQGETALPVEFDFENLSSEEKAPKGKLSYPGICRHEGAHVIAALEHAPDDSGALMRAFYDPDVSKLQPHDIKRLQAIYPPKKPVPPVTPAPNDPATGWLIKGADWQVNASGDVKIYRNGKLQSVKDSPFAG